MQRQAVPLVKNEAPIVGTGVEERAARDRGHLVIATQEGIITKVDAAVIEMQTKKGQFLSYNLNKFVRSNSSTCINQHPVVEVGE